MRPSLLVISIVLGCALVGSGQQRVSPVDVRLSAKTEVNPTPPPKTSSAAAGPPASDYVLGPGDQVSIIVLELEDDFMEKTFRVDMSGDLSLPHAGRVHASGLTTHALEQEIYASLSKIIKEPDVVVEVAEYHSQPVSVLGEVNTAGEFQVQGQKKLLAALSLAGGFTEQVGNTITITRDLQWGRIPLPNAHDDPTGQFSIASVSVKSVLHSASPEQNIQVMPSDVISVSKAEVVYVVGSVNQPGGFPLGQDQSLSTLQVLALAQGLERGAAPQKAKIIRLIPGAQKRTEIAVNVKQLLGGTAADVQLQPGDILFIPASSLKTASYRSMEAIVQTATGMAIFGRY
jgi:polysaccharide export outer membrane protein